MLDRPTLAETEPLKALWRTAGDRPARAAPPKPVLLILHQHHSHPGHVRHWFAAHGFPVDIRRPRYGEPLPETLAGHTGVVVFGGPQSANDTDAFIRREIDWIEVPLKENKPFLGICLGAQMLALHLGGSVGFHPDGYAEIGYFGLAPTQAGRTMFDWPACVYQWHREGFSLPADATLLATGEHFENQAFSYGPAAFGVQFHPEITHVLVNRWSTRASYRLVLPGAKPRAEHHSGHVAYGPAQRRWLGDLLSHWVALDESQAR